MYKIIVEKNNPSLAELGTNYSKEIYTQTVEHLDLRSVIDAVNRQEVEAVSELPEKNLNLKEVKDFLVGDRVRFKGDHDIYTVTVAYPSSGHYDIMSVNRHVNLVSYEDLKLFDRG